MSPSTYPPIHQAADSQPLSMIGGAGGDRGMRAWVRHTTSPSLSFSLTGPELQ